MIILKEKKIKKREVYTPLEDFGDRVVDLRTFFEGMRINFKRELTLSFFNPQKTEAIVGPVKPANVTINSAGVFIRVVGVVYTLLFKELDLSAITEVSCVSSINYIFPSKGHRQGYYRLVVR
jgi:hypothetical protein